MESSDLILPGHLQEEQALLSAVRKKYLLILKQSWGVPGPLKIIPAVVKAVCANWTELTAS
jgi:hypothetical protein